MVIKIALRLGEHCLRMFPPQSWVPKGAAGGSGRAQGRLAAGGACRCQNGLKGGWARLRPEWMVPVGRPPGNGRRHPVTFTVPFLCVIWATDPCGHSHPKWAPAVWPVRTEGREHTPAVGGQGVNPWMATEVTPGIWRQPSLPRGGTLGGAEGTPAEWLPNTFS